MILTVLICNKTYDKDSINFVDKIENIAIKIFTLIVVIISVEFMVINILKFRELTVDLNTVSHGNTFKYNSVGIKSIVLQCISIRDYVNMSDEQYINKYSHVNNIILSSDLVNTIESIKNSKVKIGNMLINIYKSFKSMRLVLESIRVTLLFYTFVPLRFWYWKIRSRRTIQ
jgi:hypothetical protein